MCDIKIEKKPLASCQTLYDSDYKDIFLVFSVFQIVKFKNGICTTQTGDFGTCYTEKECTDKGGMPSGPCASSFGVCCQCEFLSYKSYINLFFWKSLEELLTLFGTGLKIYVKWWGVFATPPSKHPKSLWKIKRFFFAFQIVHIEIGKVTKFRGVRVRRPF